METEILENRVHAEDRKLRNMKAELNKATENKTLLAKDLHQLMVDGAHARQKSNERDQTRLAGEITVVQRKLSVAETSLDAARQQWKSVTLAWNVRRVEYQI